MDSIKSKITENTTFIKTTKSNCLNLLIDTYLQSSLFSFHKQPPKQLTLDKPFSLVNAILSKLKSHHQILYEYLSKIVCSLFSVDEIDDLLNKTFAFKNKLKCIEKNYFSPIFNFLHFELINLLKNYEPVSRSTSFASRNKVEFYQKYVQSLQKYKIFKHSFILFEKYCLDRKIDLEPIELLSFLSLFFRVKEKIKGKKEQEEKEDKKQIISKYLFELMPYSLFKRTFIQAMPQPDTLENFDKFCFASIQLFNIQTSNSL